MKYTFVRIRSIGDTKSCGTWCLLADSVETINNHFYTYGKDYFKEGINDFINHKNSLTHFTIQLARKPRNL